MKFGIFYEHQLPRPWTERSEHKLLQDSLERFAEEVMPEFHGREPQHQEWKRDVLSGKIDLPEIDSKGFTFRGNAKPTITPDGLRSDRSTAQN